MEIQLINVKEKSLGIEPEITVKLARKIFILYEVLYPKLFLLCLIIMSQISIAPVNLAFNVFAEWLNNPMCQLIVLVVINFLIDGKIEINNKTIRSKFDKKL